MPQTLMSYLRRVLIKCIYCHHLAPAVEMQRTHGYGFPGWCCADVRECLQRETERRK